MKLTVTASLLAGLFLASTAEAQIKQGEIMLGTVLSFKNATEESVGYDKTTLTQLQFTPSLGFGLGNNWIIGPQIGFNHTGEKRKTDVTPEQTATINIFALGVWARKFHPFSGQFGIYGEAQAAAGFGSAKGEQGSIERKADASSISAAVQPGLYFLPGRKITLEATFGIIGYTSTKIDFKEGEGLDRKNGEFNVSVTDGLSLGIRFIL